MSPALPPSVSSRPEDSDRNRDPSHGYELHASEYVRLRERRPIGTAVVEDWARSLEPGREVLEIGCGAGIPVSKALVQAGLKLWALDASETLLGIFRSRFPDVPAACEVVETSGFFGRRFDAVVSIGLLFLLGESEQDRLIRRLARVLRSGGRFLFSAPVSAGSWTDEVTGQECLSLGRERYEEILSTSGLGPPRLSRDEGGNDYFETRREGSTIPPRTAVEPGPDRS